VTGLRPQIDLHHLRTDVDAVQRNIEVRGASGQVNAHAVRELYERHVAVEFQVAQLRKERNLHSKKFAAAKTQAEKE
jgi:seryl-tRNA synthetase